MARLERKLDIPSVTKRSLIEKELVNRGEELSVVFSPDFKKVAGYYAAEFSQDKRIFEEDMVIYSHRVLDLLNSFHKKNNADIKKDMVFFFPGRSGLTFDLFLREVVRQQFGVTPLSIRIPTDSSLTREYDNDHHRRITLTWIEGMSLIKKTTRDVPVDNCPVVPIENWQRDLMYMPSLDKFLKNKHRCAVIFDTCRAGGNTLKQVIFTIKPYQFDKIIYITASIGSSQDENENLGDVYEEKEEVLGTPVSGYTIIVNNHATLDNIAKSMTWLGAGLLKMPTEKNLAENQNVKLKPPPLQYTSLIKRGLLYHKDRLALRHYLRALAGLASETYSVHVTVDREEAFEILLQLQARLWEMEGRGETDQTEFCNVRNQLVQIRDIYFPTPNS